MSWFNSGRGERNYLFHSYDGFSVQQGNLQKIGEEIDALPEDRILNTDPDELERYYVERYHVEAPTLDRDNMSLTQSERDVQVFDVFRQAPVNVRGTAFDVEVPFSGDRDVFYIQPNQFDTNPPAAEVGSNTLRFSVEGRDLSAEQVKRDIEQTLGSVEKYLGFHRGFWSGYDGQIAAKARDHIQRRRQKLLSQKGVAADLASMGFKLREKPGDPKTYVAPAAKQRIEPKMPPMRAATPPDPTLDRKQYETILGLIRGAGRSIEQSSSRTRNLDEEALRDMLLVPLNAHFGSATGETFNATGKTDILVRHEGGNLFVAECKFWGGEKQFLDTIDQLLGYLTWRDTKTAAIIFNRNQGFSSVVAQLRQLPTKHPMFVAGPKQLDETSFEFTLRLPNDEGRQITVTVMGFDLGPRAAS